MEQKIQADIYDNGLLRVLNAIGFQIDLHFENFLDLLTNNSITKIISFILNLSFKEKLLNYDESNDIHNIELIVDYFKKIDQEFNIPFDFKNESKRENSLKTFLEFFLDKYFLKMKKYQLSYIFNHPNCQNIDFSKRNPEFYISDDDFGLDAIANKISMLTKKSKFESEDDISFETIAGLLKRENIATIISEEMFDRDGLLKMTFLNIMIYQIQFIFNKISINQTQNEQLINETINSISSEKSQLNEETSNSTDSNETDKSQINKETSESTSSEKSIKSQFNEETSNSTDSNELQLKVSEKIISELKKFSDKHFNDIKSQLGKKQFLTEKETKMIEKSHILEIKNAFLNIIKSNIDDLDAAINFYKSNLNILDSQIEEEKFRIHNIIEDFMQSFAKKKEIIEKDLRELSKQGMNYIMKETENIKEVEVIVDINQDLKTVIEQDF